MRIYGVYKFSNYPEWLILATDFDSMFVDGHNHVSPVETIQGMAFDPNSGKFQSMVELRLDRVGEYEEVGYVYGGNYHVFLVKEE